MEEKFALWLIATVRRINGPLCNGRKPVPAAPGIPRHMVQDVLVLRYGDLDSLNIVKQHAEELAGKLLAVFLSGQGGEPSIEPRALGAFG